jgi:hypothetical protein
MYLLIKKMKRSSSLISITSRGDNSLGNKGVVLIKEKESDLLVYLYQLSIISFSP